MCTTTPYLYALSLTEPTAIVIQLCPRSRIGLWENINYSTPNDIMYYFSFDVGFTTIVVLSMGQSGAETKYAVMTVRGQCSKYGTYFGYLTELLWQN